MSAVPVTSSSRTSPGYIWETGVTGAGRAAAPTDWNQEMYIPAAGDGKSPDHGSWKDAKEPVHECSSGTHRSCPLDQSCSMLQRPHGSQELLQ